MAEELGKILTRLGSSSNTEAKEKITIIQKTFNVPLNGAQLDYAFSTLFAEKNGIINYIREKFKNKDFGSSIVDAFKLLAYLILQNFKKRLESYIIDIKNVCVYCIVLDQPPADQKENAFEVLQALFGKGPWQKDLQVSDLINKLLRQIICKKPTPKVLAKEYHLLGIIARKHPDHMLQRSTEVLRLFFSDLDYQTSETPNVSFPLIEGCMNGLTEFLYSFTQSPEDSPENCEKIYSYLMKLSLADPEQLSRKTALRAALNLLAKHGSQLSVHLYKDYKHWHEYLNKFMSFGREEVKVAMSALSTYYEQVMANLQSSEMQDRSYAMQYFMKFFKDKLLSHDTKTREQHIVIKAFGMFAGPCHLLTSQDDVLFMFLLTVQKAKEIYQKREEHKFMADYVTSLSSIVMELESVALDQIVSLEQVTVMLIEAFPDLPSPYKSSAVRAVAGVLCSVASRGSSAMDGLFTTVVYQGVLRTCSHPVALDVELQKEQISNNDTYVSYKDYVMLWTGLLQVETYNPYLPLALRHSVINKIYDEFINTVMSLGARLNLETKTKTPDPNKDDDFPALDPRVALEAVVPRDFQVFINLCDLCRDVMTEKNLADHFRRWVFTFCHSLVCRIYRCPLVSGFYKLLTVALQLCDELHIFKDFPSGTEDSRMPCYLLLTKCLSELTCRVQQYKGDLQVACTLTILASPVQLVDKFIHQTQSVFQVSFHLGHSNIALAHLALSTLERWYNLLPASKMKLLLEVVLPDLDAYLRSMGIDDQANTDTLEVRSTSNKNSVKSFARRKNLLERPETELLKLQRHILMFLGQLDTDTSSALIYGQETECVSWDYEYHLIYDIPFTDMKVPVHLDKFLPRVVDLALSCSNRQTRVAACEFLHAVIMYMLGTNLTRELSKPGHLSKLFEKLMMPLLQLGCDTDQVVYQLFNPLVPQLARWYSSSMQLLSKHTQIFLHALMDGITHPSDTAVQDYSAKCLYEFAWWSIKQTSLKEQSNVNIKAVLKMMCSFCTHPSPVKRLGGALVFNSTYRVLREEESILDQYWLELLYYLVCNLKLVDTLCADNVNVAEQVALALDRIARVLVERVPLFCKTSKKRRVPSEFNQGQLEDAVYWLLKQCGSLQPECQRKCMELVSRLAPLLPEYGSVANFLRHQDVSKLHEICNGNKVTENVSPAGALLSQINIWLGEFLASLSCYLWLIGERLVSPQQLFEAENSIRLFRVAEYFVEQVVSKNASNMVSFLGGRTDVISIVEEEYFDLKKCSVVLKLLKLAATILRSAGNLPSTLLDYFTSTAFVQFVASCTFRPLSLGFDMRNLQLLEALPKTVENFLDATCRQENVYKSVLQELRITYSASQATSLADVTASVTSGTVSEPLNQLIQGLKTLQMCRLLSLIGCQLNGEEFIKAIISALVKTTHGSKTMVRLEPRIQIFAESVLKLSFLLGDQVEVLVHCVLDETCLQTDLPVNSYLGDHFLSTFRSAVLDQFLCHEEKSVDHILSGSMDNRSLNVIAQLLQHLLRTKHEIRYRCSATIKKVLVRHWDALVCWASASSVNTVVLLGILCDLVASLEVAVGCLKEHAALATWVASQINSQQLQQLQKNRPLELLPCLTGPDEDENLLVKSALKKYKDENIPLHSSELSPSSVEYSGFISAFNTILMALELSGSRVLLYSVISMTAGDQKHICEENIQTTLRFFISRLQPDNQVKALEVPYSIFTSRAYDPTIRLSAALRFCSTMLQACCMESLRSFMVVHIQQLLRYVSQTGLDNRKLEAEHQLVERVGAWAVFELLFCRLEQSEIECPDSRITQAAFPGAVKTGKELLVELTKRSYGVRKENIPASLTSISDVEKLFWKYQCATYKALISIISNSKRDKDDLKFYHNFLFVESETKGQIWSKIVDCSHQIAFSMDWSELPEKRKRMVAIRRSNVNAPTGGVQYLQTGTQMLFDSTLREDVTSFDFSLSVLKSRQASSQTDRESSMVVTLEIDSLNEHECMAALCGLLQHLVEQKISPPPGDSPAALPCWMEAIKKSLENEDNPPNARLFILKLILNCESYFRPYAKFWFIPIMKALLNRCAGSTINYMFTDIVAMMLEWHDIAIPNSSDIEKHLASEILSFFMSNTESSRRDVFKYIVDVVKTIVEQWKPCLVVPYQLLLDKLNSRSSADSVNNEVGLHLVAVLLANDIEPWNSAGKKLFFEYLISNLDSSKAEIYLPCAKVVGMTLKILGASGSSDLTVEATDFLQQVERKLMIMKDATSNLNKFLHCLHGMGEHCNLVVKQFATFINHKVHKLSGTMQVKCMQMISWWPEAVSDFVATGVEDFLTSHNLDVQEAALTAVSQIARQLDTPQLMVLIPNIVQFVLHQSSSCRFKMFDILMWVYVKYNESSSQQELLLFEKSRTTLIKGLVDADASVQNAVYRFWNSSERLPTATSQRLLVLMKNLYSPTTEDLLTTCLAHLLLNASKLSPDHEAKLFDHPLGNCQFEKYPMLISWRAQHTTMAPLFADTLASQLHSQDPHSVNMVVRATQESLAFKPTVDITGVADVSAASTSTFSSLNSSTLFTLGSNSRSTSEFSSKRSQLHSGFAKPETTKSFLKRRFLKNANEIRESFARREMNRNLRRQEMQQESVRRLEATVSMYRSYRIGELPDIEIPHSALIEPLQALAKHDSSVACQVVVELFLGLSNGVQDKKMFMREAEAVMNYILQSTVQCCPPVVETVLKMVLPNTDCIHLHPGHLSAASRPSGLFSLGALVLENMLLSASEDEAEIPAKRARIVGSMEVELWLQLAELYSGLDEWDVVHGVFSVKLNCTKAMKDALVAESSRNWHFAQSKYLEAINQDEAHYRDFCRQAFYKCLSHLSKWEELKTNVYEESEEDLDSLWKDQWNQEKVLPWLLTSELQLNIFGQSGDSACNWPMVEIIQGWLQDSEKANHLKCNYSEVLAMMWLLKEDYSMSRHHAVHSMNMFLASWAHVNPLAHKRRMGLLLTLSRAVEMHTYLALASIKDKESYQHHVKNLLNRWSNSVPSERDSLDIWDQRIAYRVGFAKKIEDQLNLLRTHDDHLFKQLAATKLGMELSLVDAALSQRNFYLARAYLQRTKVMLSSTSSQKRVAHWTLYFSRALYLRADQEEDQPRKFHWIMESWKELDKVLKMNISSHGPLLAKAFQHQSVLSQEIMSLIGRGATLLLSSNEATFTELLDQLSVTCHSGTDVILNKLKLFGLDCLNKAIRVMKDSAQEKEMAESYFNIAQYCRSEAMKEYGGDANHLDHSLVQSILRAMKFGSRAARQLFPCVLQLPSLSSVHRNIFLIESDDVPEWMFLAWVSQILARLDTDSVLEKVILRLVETYPQAVVFPFNISCTKYTFPDSEDGRQSQALVDRVKKILQHNPLLENFVEALTYLAPQRLILKYHLKALQTCLREVPFDRAKFCEKLSVALKESFSSAREKPRLHGSLFALEEFRNRLVNITGLDGSKVSARNIGNVLKHLKDLEEELGNSSKSSTKISDYCPWLGEFQATKFSDEIEIPGQYTGEKQPLPHLHAKVVSFAEHVRVMKSIRSPVQITINGSDAKEYKFLVKYGEDLRQDQRIQQLFRLMNEILDRDMSCCHRSLCLLTYSVVPLNSRVGIIQWVDNTETLDSVFQMKMTTEELKECDEIMASYVTWIHAASKTPLKIEAKYYPLAYDKYTRDETVAKFTELAARLPWNILRRSLESLSISPEAFFTLRHNFASSYATMCACHWLLGVGDRHLMNCLVSIKDARCVGIDFGHSFGTATQFLPVPELFPFRLTPHIVSLLRPFEQSGIFFETMVCVLRAMRSNRDMLLATMEVFVQEPSLDWLDFARQQGNDFTDTKGKQNETETCQGKWYPLQKILLARKKLQGANPAAITLEELRSRNDDSKRFEDVARGVTGYNVRASMNSENLSPEDQVCCLLDQATDYHILGKTWCGWKPWM